MRRGGAALIETMTCFLSVFFVFVGDVGASRVLIFGCLILHFCAYQLCVVSMSVVMFLRRVIIKN